jgi:hypothetical protein
MFIGPWLIIYGFWIGFIDTFTIIPIRSQLQ